MPTYTGRISTPQRSDVRTPGAQRSDVSELQACVFAYGGPRMAFALSQATWMLTWETPRTSGGCASRERRRDASGRGHIAFIAFIPYIECLALGHGINSIRSWTRIPEPHISAARFRCWEADLRAGRCMDGSRAGCIPGPPQRRTDGLTYVGDGSAVVQTIYQRIYMKRT